MLLVVKNAVYYQAGDKHDDVREWKCPSDFSRLDEAVAANRTRFKSSTIQFVEAKRGSRDQ